MILLAAGCTSARGSGALHVESRAREAVALAANFTTAVYHQSAENVASIYLCDASLDQLLEGTIERGQIVHIEVLWEPYAGKTPIDASATNISIRHIVVNGAEVGVYGGAGFASTHGDIGKSTVSLSIPSASLSLLERTANFNDPLSPAEITGNLTAVHDPSLSRKIALATSQIVTNKLGRPRYVRAE